MENNDTREKQTHSRQTIISFILIAVLIVGGYWLYNRTKSATETLPKQAVSKMAFEDLGVQIEVPSSVQDLVYATRTVQTLGTIAEVSTRAIIEQNPNCSIGVVYTLSKEKLAESNTNMNEGAVKAATEWRDGVPPQAKEFPEFYFVYEPSQAACTENVGAEAAQRMDFWKSIQSATLLNS